MGHTFGCVSVWPRCPRGTGGIPHEKSPPIAQAHWGGAVPACWGATGAGAVALGPGGSPLFHLLGVSLGPAPPPRVDPARGGSLSAQVGSRGWPSLCKPIASWKEGARSSVFCAGTWGGGPSPFPSPSGRGWGAPVRLLDNGPRAPSGFLRGDRFRLSKSLRLRSFSPACTPPSSRLAPPAWRSC
jgi:hypothetical protein